MAKQSGHSEDRERILGDEYQQHFDEDGRKSGTSEDREKLLGDEYTQHFDDDGRKDGYSEVKERLLGGEYTQHYDKEGRKAGYSEEKEGLLGNKYIEHYDENGKVIGRTEEHERLLGGTYEKHEYDPPQRTYSSEGSESSGCIAGAIALFAIFAVIMAGVIWLPMIVVSSIATFVLAEGIKKEANWVKEVQSRLKKIVWFGPAVASVVGLILFIGVVTQPGEGGFAWFIGILGFGSGVGASWFLSEKILNWRLKYVASSD